MARSLCRLLVLLSACAWAVSAQSGEQGVSRAGGPGRYANVMDYGAKGNGVADDTAAFRAAIHAACDGQAAGVVFAPAGRTFLLSAPLGWPARCHAASNGATIVWSPGCNCSWYFSGTNNTIEGWTFNGKTGPAYAQIGAALLFGNGASDFRIFDDTFENLQNGGAVTMNGNGNTPATVGPGIIERNVFRHNTCGPSPPVFTLQGGLLTHDIVVGHNIFRGGCDYEIGFDGSSHVVIVGNMLDESRTGTAAGIQIEATNGPIDSVSVIGNDIHDFAACASCTGIHIAATDRAATNVIVADNIVSNGGRGIVAETVGKGTINQSEIEGNIIHDIGLTCITANWDHSIITGNIAFNCGESRPMNGDHVAFSINGRGEIVSDNLAFDNQSSHTTGYAFSYSRPTYGSNNVAGSGTRGIANPGNLIASRLTARTGKIGGTVLAAGQCIKASLLIPGATAAIDRGATVLVTPTAYPGDGFDWDRAYLGAKDTVVVQVCADARGIPAAANYNVTVN